MTRSQTVISRKDLGLLRMLGMVLPYVHAEELTEGNLAGLHTVQQVAPCRVVRFPQSKDTTMKRIKEIPPLPPDATDDEMIRWTETYDLGARLDAGVSEIVEIHEPPQDKEGTTQLTLRIPSSMKVALQRLARRRTMNVTTLARLWIAERLQQELKAQQ